MKLTITLNDPIAVTNLEALAAKQGIRPTPCAAEVLRQALLNPPPPPPEPTKTKLWLSASIIGGTTAIIVAVVLMQADVAASAVKQGGDATKRVLSTPPLVRKSPPGTGRLYLGERDQNEALDRLVGAATTNILWIVGGPLDARILTRLRDAKRRSPGLNIALLVGPDLAKASVETLASREGFNCHIAKAPLGEASYIAINEDWILHVSAHAITSVRDPAAVDHIWDWVDATIGKGAVEAHAPNSDKR